MKRVHFSMNYKAAEAYMARMCQKGWAAVRRTGGLWTFAPCKPSQYAFRLCCLRGLLGEELDSRKRRLAGALNLSPAVPPGPFSAARAPSISTRRRRRTPSAGKSAVPWRPGSCWGFWSSWGAFSW